MQKKSLWLTYFPSHCDHTQHLFREPRILKMRDEIALENYLFINKYFDKVLTTIFKNGLVPLHKTKLYGRKPVDIIAIYTSNYLQQLNDLSPRSIKCVIKEFLISKYK